MLSGTLCSALIKGIRSYLELSPFLSSPDAPFSAQCIVGMEFPRPKEASAQVRRKLHDIFFFWHEILGKIAT